MKIPLPFLCAVLLFSTFSNSANGAEPALQIDVASVRLKWLAVSNEVYQVQWSAKFQDWTNLTTVLGNGTVTNIVDSVEGEQRFYRLIYQGDLNKGLAAYYPFNGDANDLSGNGNNGTVNGASLAFDRFGNANHAYSFDGTNNFIELPPSSVFDSEDYTVSLWFNVSGYPKFVNADDAEMLIQRQEQLRIASWCPSVYRYRNQIFATDN